MGWEKTINNAKEKQVNVSEEAKWDKISWGKCKHAFLIEMCKKGFGVEAAEPIAEQWADASMRKMETNVKEDTLPVIEEQTPLMDIPF